MNLTAVGMVRDEADIIGHTVTNLRRQGVDQIIVADNGSTDDTRALLTGCVVLKDEERGYYQDRKMTSLAATAREAGADWVLPFDADELWFSPDGRTIRQVLEDTTADVVAAVEYKHWPTPWDNLDTNPYRRLMFREPTPHRLHKVCFRAHPDAHVHMGNHGVNLGPYNPDRADPAEPLLELRHLPYRSFGQFCRKVRQGREAYEAACEVSLETIAGHPMSGTHWKEMGALGDDDLARVWSDATSGYGWSDRWLGHPDLIRDPAPWPR